MGTKMPREVQIHHRKIASDTGTEKKNAEETPLTPPRSTPPTKVLALMIFHMYFLILPGIAYLFGHVFFVHGGKYAGAEVDGRVNDRIALGGL